MHVYLKQVNLLHSKWQRSFTSAFSSCSLCHKDNVMDLSANLLMRAVRTSTSCMNACNPQGAFVLPAQNGAAKQLQLKLKCLLNYHGLSSADFEAVSAAAVVCPLLSCDSIMNWLSSMDMC